jgi:hypothetical protein
MGAINGARAEDRIEEKDQITAYFQTLNWMSPAKPLRGGQVELKK